MVLFSLVSLAVIWNLNVQAHAYQEAASRVEPTSSFDIATETQEENQVTQEQKHGGQNGKLTWDDYVPAVAKFQMLDQHINDSEVTRWLESQGAVVFQFAGAKESRDAIQKQFPSVPATTDVEIPAKNESRNRDESLYQAMAKSSLVISQRYNCGKCDLIHQVIGGGVIVDESGLVLTNHHVMKPVAGTEGMIAMTYDGRVWPIVEVLAASETNDVALIRLGKGAADYKFHSAKLAEQVPRPMDAVRLIHNPYNCFFSMTQGEVSRFSMYPSSSAGGKNTTWMEITADFGQGSSGSAVFDQRGDVVGLVSRISVYKRTRPNPTRKDDEAASTVEYSRKACVSLPSIRALFEKGK